MSKWIGYAVSVNCGEPLGCYQGTILDADGSTITLTKAFRNGFPYPKSQVTLNAADIKELKIIEARAEPAQQPHSTVAVAKSSKKAARATVCENLQANPSSSDRACGGGSSERAGVAAPAARGRLPAAGPRLAPAAGPRLAPAAGPRLAPAAGPRLAPLPAAAPTPAKATHAGSYGHAGSTPKSRGAGPPGGTGGLGGHEKARGAGPPGGTGGLGGHEKARRRNEACFGDAADLAIDRDFDFEGNLALFDKRALWEQMNNQKPDLVRQTGEASKFRHDENVLGGALGGVPAARRAIIVPDALRDAQDYVTDDGLVVPSAASRLRRALWAGLARMQLAEGARVLLARACADVCVRLVGGGRRLEARNAHQAPAVCVLCAPHAAGVTALVCARLLASHGARVAVHVSPAPPERAERAERGEREDVRLAWERELAALVPGDVTVAERLEQLPRPDLLLLALYCSLRDDPPDLYSAASAWAVSMRALCVCVEPGGGAAAAGAPRCRAAVQALLPAAPAAPLGRAMLADVAPPPQLFRDLRLAYRPPFGAAPIIALHPHDGD